MSIVPANARGGLLLRDDLPRVKLDQHGPVRLHLFEGNRQSEVVEDEELELEVVEFDEGKPADLARRNNQHGKERETGGHQ